MSGRIRELDGIRGIAILMVLVWHYYAGYGNIHPEGSLLSYIYLPTTAFWSGVDLFFVLSGFLIGGIILDNHEKPNFLKVFWIRRCCRILPVLALLFLMCFAAGKLVDRDQFRWLFGDLMPWWSYATFTQNIVMGVRETFGGHFLAVTWSLAVEEQFYLFAPLLIIVFGRRRWVGALIPLILVAFALRIAFWGFHANINTIFRMDALLVGVVVAVAIRNAVVRSLLEQHRESLLAAFIVLLMITGALIVVDGLGQFKFSWFAILYGSFLTVVLLFRETRMTWLLRMPALCFWGGIAYGLYMYHQAISGLLHGWLRAGAEPSFDGWRAVWITGLAFLLSTLAAWISFKLYEIPFLRLGKRFRYGASESQEQPLEVPSGSPEPDPENRVAV